ncbi:hypothetical protein MJG53_010022 [Ovis ammon polii x Ovis aries]|uniref:Uncharacterized protein n=1 Tax=Ovis ammon polii x Ovis aries TaxID=2918886 RepID=A0ACB9UVN2_9CETA|nr:hypothetical protein MJG53_010022 [Ovis ammon polii x Ovis aries]
MSWQGHPQGSDGNDVLCNEAVKFAWNFYYITMLRDPVSRYLSEWKHVQRGATWKTSLHMCDGRSPTPDELPTCYPGDDWSGVSLREFMDCTYNLANNRQVRMLADLSLVGCYNLTFMNESERNAILLQSAKSNLKNMAFFGLTEFQRKTQFLFERTFNLKFISPFTQFNITRASNVEINEGARRRIEELNFLDVQLYEYAKDLFQQRYHRTKQLERQRDRQRRRGERRLQRDHRGHRWPKQEGNPEGAVTEDYNSQVISIFLCSQTLFAWTVYRAPVPRPTATAQCYPTPCPAQYPGIQSIYRTHYLVSMWFPDCLRIALMKASRRICSEVEENDRFCRRLEFQVQLSFGYEDFYRELPVLTGKTWQCQKDGGDGKEG